MYRPNFSPIPRAVDVHYVVYEVSKQIPFIVSGEADEEDFDQYEVRDACRREAEEILGDENCLDVQSLVNSAVHRLGW
jgi:hypothetical protein